MTAVGIDFRRLRVVRDQIVAAPATFSMEDWVTETTACIGGFAAFDAGFVVRRESRHPERFTWYEPTAACPPERYPYDEGRFAAALNLVAEEADRLFDVDRWPLPYSDEYAHAPTPEARASVAARRIDFFVRTRGKQ